MSIKNVLRVLGLLSISLFVTVPAMADLQIPEIARKAGCMACHAVDRKIIGPAFGWVAHKYKDAKEEGRKAIANQIVNGGSEQWIRYTGGISMPPLHAQTTESQRNDLAGFILNLEPIAPPEK